jgi:hypothetical protein
MEVARALLLPDFTLPPREVLTTLPLFWESIELPLHAGMGDPPDDQRELIETLIEEGVLRIHHLPRPDHFLTAEAVEIAAVWARTPPDTTAATVDPALAEEIIAARARRVAGTLQYSATAAAELAAELAAAPIVSSSLGFLASSLPALATNLPLSEATVIHLAVEGATVDPATPIDKVLKFREDHKQLAGRLRGALIDVAASIQPGGSMIALAAQAEAAVKNRVEPALGALESELQRNKISFAWSNVLGFGGVLATGGHSTATALGGGAELISRSIRYAFDRDALVRDHPLGYLHKVRASFLGNGEAAFGAATMPTGAAVTDLNTLLLKMYLAAYEVGPRDGYGASIVGVRSTDPAACERYLWEWGASNHPNYESWWNARERRR